MKCHKSLIIVQFWMTITSVWKISASRKGTHFIYQQNFQCDPPDISLFWQVSCFIFVHCFCCHHLSVVLCSDVTNVYSDVTNERVKVSFLMFTIQHANQLFIQYLVHFTQSVLYIVMHAYSPSLMYPNYSIRICEVQPLH